MLTTNSTVIAIARCGRGRFVLPYCMGIAMDGDPKCRLYFETEGGLQVVLNLVPRSKLCQWSEIPAHLGEFLDGFVVTDLEQASRRQDVRSGKAMQRDGYFASHR